jgi:hypothetical protein
MIRLLAAAATLSLLPLAGGATAQTGTPVARADLTPVERMNMAVATHVFDFMGSYGDLFPPELTFGLGLIAKAKAIALTCDGFEVNEARYNAAMSGLLERYITMNAEGSAVNLPFTIAMSGYSMLLGGSLAAAAYDPAATCALGARLRAQIAEDGDDSLLIWSDPD